MSRQQPLYDLILIDDDPDVLASYRHLFELSGYHPLLTSDPQLVLSTLHGQWSGVVISDIYMPAMHGLELLSQIQGIDPQIPVVMITGHGEIPLAVEAVKKGAYDFIEKPLDPAAFLSLIKTAQNQRQAICQQRQAIADATEHELIGSSAQISAIRDQVQALACTDQDALIQGKLGTGRHTVAQLLHQLSERHQSPYILCDCHQCDDQDLQAQIDAAQGGTLVLRQLSRLPRESQRWLAQYLLDQERLGDKQHRTLALFDQCAAELVREQQLHSELYYYFSQTRIVLPTLAERHSDIIPLFRAFLQRSAKRLGIATPKVERSYFDVLKHHQWPGNIRELRNVAELYAVGIVKLTNAEQNRVMEPLAGPLDNLVDDYEKRLIEDALFLSAGRVSEAADYLQIPRKKLYLRMRKHQLDKALFKPQCG
ncbi:C4-dicarboxylate transport transcriptional regulatory protein DctD [Vibrio stylophorae]|uniref:C4-dicarboxylate transport transcriptional regulatory protein DctD n=1 Tax=Vibrio stylophorae TaxID=659351 RepID=A0ABM8ZRS6_9VIBR|nr:sigma-54 dependent transcriptional regulator [Vibrio stylophorae]CAH0532805.1 C4-dicarboxylate transport transcriptional regulatory protein DctD [Vibrio stylophorae]